MTAFPSESASGPQRAAVVDGRLDITSPPGGPTRITVELPLRT